MPTAEMTLELDTLRKLLALPEDARITAAWMSYADVYAGKLRVIVEHKDITAGRMVVTPKFRKERGKLVFEGWE